MFSHTELPMLHRLQATARRVTDMIHQRAVKEYSLAVGGVVQHLDMCIIHNSLVSREQGKPWQEINYDHMRRAKWLVEQSYIPHRIVNAWYQRKCAAR
jgi:hypothetical protein